MHCDRDEYLNATAERIHLLCANAILRMRNSAGDERDAAFRAHIEDVARLLAKVRTHNNGLIEK